MMKYENALSIVLTNVPLLSKKKVRLEDLSGYFLAKPVITKFDVPLFDNSAVDGFGVQISNVKNISANSPVKLNLMGTIYAGDFKNINLKNGSTVKILTGAKISPGVEAVIMKEFCSEQNGTVLINKSASYGENIRKQGEEFKRGNIVLKPGIRIIPPVVGLLASLGYNSTWVYRKPKITLIITGSELVKVGKELETGKIYESNSYAIGACLNEIGIDDYETIIVKDKKSLIKTYILSALKKSDLIITVGGISTGEKDYVKDIFTEAGVKCLFKTIAIKPAKPNYFGVYKNGKDKKLAFGLPGNPVSALVSFQKLIKPAILKMMGATGTNSFSCKAGLGKDLKKKTGRLEFVRGILEQKNGNLIATPTFGQGSHMLGGIAKANCIIYFPKNKKHLSKGNKVKVELLNWS